MINNNLKITYIKIHDLRFADYNPRKATEQEVKQLKENIEKFGLVDPIIVNSNPARKNIIIGGHFRTRISKELGYSEMPCVLVDIESIEKEKELNIRLNKNQGSFDFDLLGNHFDLEDLQEWGFTANELGIGDISSSVGNVNKEISSEGLGNQSIITLKFDNVKYLEILDLLHQAKDGLGFATNEELIENLLKDNV